MVPDCVTIRPALPIGPATMRMSIRTLLLLLLCTSTLVLTACGDIRVRHVPPPEVVPAELEGEWAGTWVSDETGETGTVGLRVQEFEGEPVIEVIIDHPAVVPGAYQLSFTGDAILLQVDGNVVFAASLVEASRQELDGSFDWGGDQGTWSATWQRALPEPVDLGGTWQGVLQTVDGVPLPFTIELDQFVVAGQLGLSGLVALPAELWGEPVPVTGFVTFDDQGFQFLMQTEPGFPLQFLLSGRGDREPLQVPLGLLQILAPQLPFSQAVLQMARVQ